MKLFHLFMGCCLFFASESTNAQNWNWARSFGDTTANTFTTAITRYGQSDILIAGSFSSKTLKMGTFILENTGRSDAFVALLDSSGNYLWAKSYGGSSDEMVKAITSDVSGNIYLAGTFNSLSVKFGSHTLSNKGENDGFLVKINPEKEVEWAFGFGGLPEDVISGLATDADGNIYATGYITDYQKNEFSIFITKIDSEKNTIWLKKAKVTGYYAISSALAIDDENNCYVTGLFNQDLVFDATNKITSTKAGEEPFPYYENNAFIAKYTSDGVFVKAIAVDSLSEGTGLIYSIDNIYLSGEKVNYGFGWGWPLSDSKIFLAKYNKDLKPIWTKSTGGSSASQSLDISNGISVDDLGNIYQTGYFFSFGFKFGNDSLLNIFNKDYYYQQIFVLKYNSDGNAIWGKYFGNTLCDIGTCIQAIADDKFYLSGTYESNTIQLGTQVMHNNGYIREEYVHLRPPREVRNTFAFIAKYSDGPVGIKPNPKEHLAIIYPNPVKNDLFILMNETNITGGEVSIYRLDGSLVWYKSIKPANSKIGLNVTDFNPGIYLIKLKIDNVTSIHKVVKE
jgi:hypothetical protein